MRSTTAGLSNDLTSGNGPKKAKELSLQLSDNRLVLALGRRWVHGNGKIFNPSAFYELNFFKQSRLI